MNPKSTSRYLLDEDQARQASLAFYYIVAVLSTTIGILVVFILNIFTPFSMFQSEFYRLTHGLTSLLAILTRQAIPRALILILISAGSAVLAVHILLVPIRSALDLARQGRVIPRALLRKARKRLINLPFMFIPISVCLWIVMPLIALSMAFILEQVPPRSGIIVFSRACMIGLVVSMMAYHRMESFSRQKLIPLFFPEGRMAEETGVARLSISRRLNTLNRFGVVIPVVIMFVTLITLQFQVEAQGISARDYGYGIIKFLAVLFLYFIFATRLLNRIVSKSISAPVEDMIRVLQKIRSGIFHERVRVVSNDEIGYAGDVINEMAADLADRQTMQESLNLAKEVQQNLLPKQSPRIPGFDVFGKSIYCDETGGDYFDFLVPPQQQGRELGIVIGDVSGHGIASALLMATARGILRQRFALPGRMAQIISDVNAMIARDIADTGSFMTLFCLKIHSSENRLEWVRAGQDPAILYSPDTDEFSLLKGRGIALGLDETANYEDNVISDLKSGQVILLATDGIFEARNTHGEMFGRQRVLDLIKTNCIKGAQEITELLLDHLYQFMGEREIEDDLTLVVIRVE